MLDSVPGLREAMDTYCRTFGHVVPAHVAAMYATQPGPLLVEIRQAVALQRPVSAWLKHAKDPAARGVEFR